MSRVALVIGHHEGDHAGALVPPMEAAGFEVRTWIPETGETPPAREPDLLVILGGIMGANDEAEHPWMTGELRLVERHVAAGRPTLGLCLGGQILARVLGARVFRAEAVELGYPPLTPTGDSAALAAFAGNEWRIMQWHQDVFDLPEGATHLARSEMTPNQAFEWGGHCLGLQCHPEAEAATVHRWLDKNGAAAERAGYDVDAIRAEVDRWGRGMETAGAAMMARWLDEQFGREERRTATG